MRTYRTGPSMRLLNAGGSIALQGMGYRAPAGWRTAGIRGGTTVGANRPDEKAQEPCLPDPLVF